MDNYNGVYMKLGGSGSEEATVEHDLSPKNSRRFCSWIKWIIPLILVGVLAVVFTKWIGPFLMDKELIPIINWEISTFSKPVLGILIFASMAIFPTFILPSSPSMWLAGMSFGYGIGFLLIITGAAVGISIPYLIGSLFYHKIQVWLEKYPKNASIIRSAGEGNWFHQFRAVALIRISPFPYILYNYCAVATNVYYRPYLLGSLVGMVPEIFVAIYTGVVIGALADEGHIMTGSQLVINAVGVCAAVATTIFFTAYAKAQLKGMHQDDRKQIVS